MVHWSKAAASTGESSASSMPRRVAASRFRAVARLSTVPDKPAPAAGGLGVEQRLGDPAVVLLREGRVEAKRAERVLHQIPAVDRLDFRLHRLGEHGVPDLAGVAGSEDDQMLTVRPVGGERIEDGEHGGARGHRDRDLPALVLDAELRFAVPLRGGAQQEHRVLRVAATAGEGAAQLQLDDRPVGDELHQRSTIRQAISNSASGFSSAASQIRSTNAGTSRARTRSGDRTGAPGRAASGPGCTSTGGRFPDTGPPTSETVPDVTPGWSPTGSGFFDRLRNRVIASSLALRSGAGQGDLLLIAARGLAQRRDDHGRLGVTVAGREIVENLPVHLAQRGRQALRAVQVRVVEGVLPGQVRGGEHADGLRVIGGRGQT